MDLSGLECSIHSVLYRLVVSSHFHIYNIALLESFALIPSTWIFLSVYRAVTDGVTGVVGEFAVFLSEEIHHTYSHHPVVI